MSDRAELALHYINVGIKIVPEDDTPCAELLRQGFVCELPDAADGRSLYSITAAGVRELAARRDMDLANAISRAVMAAESRYVERWASAEIRRRILIELAETPAGHSTKIGQKAVDYYLLTGRRQNA